MRPNPEELIQAHRHYVSLVPEGDVLTALSESEQKLLNLTPRLLKMDAAFSYAPDKWSLGQLMQHLVDTERILAYRALCFTRSERVELPSFDHERYADAVKAQHIGVEVLLNELKLVRQGNLLMFRHFDDEMLLRTGMAGGVRISVNTIGFVMAGHLIAHLETIATKYLHGAGNI